MDNWKRTKLKPTQVVKQRVLKHQKVNQAGRKTGHREKKSRYELWECLLRFFIPLCKTRACKNI